MDIATSHIAEARNKRMPGARRLQILQTLAAMLEDPKGEKVTTAALAAKLNVSEAALYRHFASKAQMFEGLIEFIESSVFTLVNQIAEREGDGAAQAQKMLTVLLQFGEKNPGMTRVMVGDALVFENERLSARMNQFFDRLESQFRQSLRTAAEAGERAGQLVLRCLELRHLGRIAQILAAELDAGCLGARLDHAGEDALLLFGRALGDGGEVGDEVGALLEGGLDIGPLGLGDLFLRGHGVDAAGGKTGAGDDEDGGLRDELTHLGSSLHKPRNDRAAGRG